MNDLHKTGAWPRSTLVWAYLFIVFVLAFPTGIAQAYLDPGSGSFIIQVLVTSLLGLLLSIKLFGARILDIFRRRPRSTQADVATDEAVTPRSEQLASSDEQ